MPDTIYVDVDGTLLYWPNENPAKKGRPARPGEPLYGVPPTINEALVSRLCNGDIPFVIWTTGGADHARRAAQICGLDASPLLLACLGKPTVVIDDNTAWLRKHRNFDMLGPEDAF